MVWESVGEMEQLCALCLRRFGNNTCHGDPADDPRPVLVADMSAKFRLKDDTDSRSDGHTVSCYWDLAGSVVCGRTRFGFKKGREAPRTANARSARRSLARDRTGDRPDDRGQPAVYSRCPGLA